MSPNVAHRHPPSPPSTEPLPPGWVKQYDPASQRDFYVSVLSLSANIVLMCRGPQVDTAIPRSTWSHPYKDEQYLRETARREKQNIRRHSSASQGIASPVIVAPQRERCANGEPAKKKLKLVSASPTVPAPTALYDFPVRTHGMVYVWS
jgi:hypothetical protein